MSAEVGEIEAALGVGVVASPASGRIAAFDWLRVVAVAGVLLLHAVGCYMVHARADWYVVDPARSLVCDALAVWLDAWVVPALFFSAGFFLPGSVVRAGPARSLWRRARRLGIPFVIGVGLFSPVGTYFLERARPAPLPFWRWYLTRFWGPDFRQGHFWYLGVLLAFSALATPWAGRLARSERGPGPGASVAWAFALSVGAFVLASGWWPDPTWLPVGYLLTFQPSRVVLELAAFLIGIRASRHPELLSRLSPRAWASSAAAASILLLVARAVFQVPTALGPRVVIALCLCASCLGTVLAVLALLVHLPASATPGRSLLVRTSYATYLIHQLFLLPAAWLLLPLAWPALLKLAAVVVIAAVGSLATSALLVRLPGVREIL